MSKILSKLLLVFLFASFTSCFEDRDDTTYLNNLSVVGTWELTTWTLQIPIDLNDDAISSINLLDEAVCINNETLTFDTDGTVASNLTYNPQVTISLTNGTTDNYIFDVECDTDGSVVAFGMYTQTNAVITLFETTATINENQLTIVYADAIDIYNEDLTEIVQTKDLTLVYTKK